ncbi:MAG: C40 family peptidase [bacterium]|nr:C40 family peptidase [bacterium]
MLLIACLLLNIRALYGQIDTPMQFHLLVQTGDSLTFKPKKRIQADSVINYAYTFMGDRYMRGGTSTKGFDCSGYTMTVYKNFGIKLPHTSAGQSFIGVEIPRKQISKGDLLFFRGRSSRRRGIGHVGIVISEKGQPVQFIHSSTSSGVRIDRIEAEYYKKRFMKATRVLPLN